MDKFRSMAFNLASKGFPVFPLHSIKDGLCTCGKLNCGSPGKHPRTLNGYLDGTTNTLQIEKWWGKWLISNIGMVTGKASGVIVLDIDPRHGGDETLNALEEEYGKLPQTKVVITGGGGQHIYFAYPGSNGGCKTNLFPGIDVRGDGGYVLAPPSLHISGRQYEWEVSSFESTLATIPKWLFSHLGNNTNRREHIKRNLALNQDVPEGCRNVTITSLSGYLISKGISDKVALQLCNAVNQTRCRPPLPQEEVLKIVNSIARKERNKRQGGQHE
jgi:hypothetical protein